MAVKNYGIFDKWLNSGQQNVVDVKSTDGVINSVKVNGQEYGGGGSSDFSTAKVTVTGITYNFNGNNPNGEDIWTLLKINNHYYSSHDFYLDESQTEVYDVLLLGESGRFVINKNEGEVSVTGDATISSDEYDYYITFTGDCTITIS